MQQHYPYKQQTTQQRTAMRMACLLIGLLLSATAAALAQAPAWTAATTGSAQLLNGTSEIQATTVDASGNVFVAGYFTGQIAFGGTVLTSAGSTDIFVAKWVPATSTWAWARRGGLREG